MPSAAIPIPSSVTSTRMIVTVLRDGDLHPGRLSVADRIAHPFLYHAIDGLSQVIVDPILLDRIGDKKRYRGAGCARTPPADRSRPPVRSPGAGADVPGSRAHDAASDRPLRESIAHARECRPRSLPARRSIVAAVMSTANSSGPISSCRSRARSARSSACNVSSRSFSRRFCAATTASRRVMRLKPIARRVSSGGPCSGTRP